MKTGGRLFVFLIFAVLGLSFFATTVMLAGEFGQAWLDFASMDSHLFIFFPTLGCLALVAFYIPACIFVDLYWRHVKFGKVRFLFGSLLVAAGSYGVANMIIAGVNRSMWEIAPRVLIADNGDPSGCSSRNASCLRLPLMETVRNLRIASRNRWGLGEFVRDCATGPSDPLIEAASQSEKRRFCFAATPLTTPPALMTDAECCRAQSRLVTTVRTLYADPNRRSTTAMLHAALLPMKVFFLLIVLVISIMLAAHHKNIERYYGAYMVRIEFGLLIGTISMLLFPLMSQAFVQSSGALYGSSGRGPFVAIMPLVSFMFMIWALLIGLFFYRRKANDTLVSIGRLGGLIASNVGIIKYTLLISIVAWALGAGASEIALASLAGGCAALAVIVIWFMRPPRKSRSSKTPEAAGTV